jgi:hypothetical protein
MSSLPEVKKRDGRRKSTMDMQVQPVSRGGAELRVSAKLDQARTQSSKEDANRPGNNVSRQGSSVSKKRPRRNSNANALGLLPKIQRENEAGLRRASLDVAHLANIRRASVSGASDTAVSALKHQRDLAVVLQHPDMVEQHLKGVEGGDIHNRVDMLAAQIRKDEADKAKVDQTFSRQKTRRLSQLARDMHSVQERWVQHIYLCRCLGIMQRQLSEVRHEKSELSDAAGLIQGFWKAKFATGAIAAEAVSRLSQPIQWRWGLNVRCFKRKFAANTTRLFFRKFGAQKLRLTMYKFRRDVILMQQWMRSWVQVLHARLVAMSKRVAHEEERIYGNLVDKAVADLKAAEEAARVLPAMKRVSDVDEIASAKRAQLKLEKTRVECAAWLQKLTALGDAAIRKLLRKSAPSHQGAVLSRRTRRHSINIAAQVNRLSQITASGVGKTSSEKALKNEKDLVLANMRILQCMDQSLRRQSSSRLLPNPRSEQPTRGAGRRLSKLMPTNRRRSTGGTHDSRGPIGSTVHGSMANGSLSNGSMPNGALSLEGRTSPPPLGSAPPSDEAASAAMAPPTEDVPYKGVMPQVARERVSRSIIRRLQSEHIKTAAISYKQCLMDYAKPVPVSMEQMREFVGAGGSDDENRSEKEGKAFNFAAALLSAKHKKPCWPKFRPFAMLHRSKFAEAIEEVEKELKILAANQSTSEQLTAALNPLSPMKDLPE